MKANDLFHRVVFEPPARDAHGEDAGWNAAAGIEARAYFRFLRGGAGTARAEEVLAARLQGTQIVVVTVRASFALAGVTPAWRLRDARSATVFNIRSGPVLTDDRRWFEFTVESGVAV